MSSLPDVLIFTYSDYGQANVALATAYELALAGVNVYIASFAPLRPRILRLQELVDRRALHSSGKPSGSVNFCECKGFASWPDAVIKQGVKNADFSHSLTVWGALESYSKVDLVFFPRDQEERCAAIESCKEIIQTIKPNLVVVDVLFNIARDACKALDQKFIFISPNAVKDLVVGKQPNMAALWKYPALSSGFPFPLEWWQIPLNICLNICLVMYITFSVRVKQVRALRMSLGFEFEEAHQATQLGYGATNICPSLAEIDFPLAVIPEDVYLCGPIIMPFEPLEKIDPVLMKWLDNGPTVIVNLGSHVLADGKVAREMANAFRILLDYHDRRGVSKIQVLWKAMPSGEIRTVLDEIIGKEIKEGRVKVLPWLDAEPVSILQHPNMVCTVHHGGANSFYEGVWSGIPHIVLPVWYDTYEFAARAEFLNIGIFANKTCAPSVQGEEFGKALVRVTGDTEEATKFRMSAKHLKELCRAKGNGRELSCMAILKEAAITK